MPKLSHSAKLTPKQKAAKLREFGFNVQYGKRGKSGKGYLAKVTREWKKVESYVENKKQTFVFQKAKGKTLAAVGRGLSKKQVTPGGFFLRKPRGAKKSPKYTVKKDGTIFYRAQGPKGGRVIEEIHPIDPELLAEDPPKAILALAKRKDKVVLTVNGFNSSKTLTYTLDALAFYVAQDLLPKFLDPNIDPDYSKAHGSKGGSIEDFCDIFHVKIIKHVSAKDSKTTKRRVSRNRRR